VTDIEAVQIRRSKDGRPYIKQDIGKEVLYSRVSTFAKALSDGAGLAAWKMRMAYLGLQDRPDLMGFTDRQGIDAALAAAMDHAGANDAADLGTALHALADVFDFSEGGLSRDAWDLAPHVWDAMDRYVEVTKGLTMLAGEQFVVIDAMKVAGSFDRLIALPDGRIVIGDLKTGTLRMQEHAIQLACYARGLRYDVETGARSLIHENIDTSVGVVIHVPRDPSIGETRLVGVDLEAGWEMALLAQRVRATRSRKVEISITREEEAIHDND